MLDFFSLNLWTPTPFVHFVLDMMTNITISMLPVEVWGGHLKTRSNMSICTGKRDHYFYIIYLNPELTR